MNENEMYKVGDKVRVVGNRVAHEYPLGKEGKIVRTQATDNGRYWFHEDYSLHTFLSYSDLELIDAPTVREKDADILRKTTIPTLKRDLKKHIKDKEAEIEAAERKAELLEKYETEEDAQAATIAGILKTGGDEATIKQLIKDFKLRVS